MSLMTFSGRQLLIFILIQQLKVHGFVAPVQDLVFKIIDWSSSMLPVGISDAGDNSLKKQLRLVLEKTWVQTTLLVQSLNPKFSRMPLR